jgi:hypothetical protein
MKTRKKKIIRTILLLVGILILPLLKMYAEDLRSVTQLRGQWKFSIGDQEEWKLPQYDDSHWDEIFVSKRWESEGYDEYNGFAWYRKQFRLNRAPQNAQLYLVIDNIDDCDEVFLNGQLIGKSGSLPPYYNTAYGFQRKYPLPDDVINTNGNNTLAIRVYDGIQDGGIVGDRVGIYYDQDIEYLNLNLAGQWKFKIGNDRAWKLEKFNDGNWEEMSVPASWESQGYEDYDGYAWYRKQFRLPSSLDDKDLYISLGKIDDYDVVYINGEEIGEVYDLAKDADYRRRGYEYNARRLYKIPESLLKKYQPNTIAIRVYDDQQRGGIYEGPIGLMDEENYRDYRRKYRDGRGFWDFVFDQFSN